MTAEIYKLKISTKDIKPSIWRTVLVPSSITFLDLHWVIIELFGFTGYHLFAFASGSSHLNTVISDGDDGTRDANKIKLYEVFTNVGKLDYTYDFGDNWNFTITLQKITLRNKNEVYPQCIKSKGGMLIEDCGGSHAYELIAAWRRNPTQKAKDTIIDFLGNEEVEWYNDFNPDDFDINAVKFREMF